MTDRSLAKISIHLLKESDIDLIVRDSALHHWPKPRAIFEKYLKEQEEATRIIWVAYEGCGDHQQFTGYVTLTWHSLYPSFQKLNIPEIMDLNVLPPYRGQGIGSKLLQTAENHAFQKGGTVGIGVGLYSRYGAAQKLYIARGYQSDGQGITYNYKTVQYGEQVPLDEGVFCELCQL